MDSQTKKKDVPSDKLKNSLFNRQKGNLIKVAIAALIITTLTYNFAFAKEETHSLEQIYHVYVGDQYVGAVNSQQEIDDVINKKEEAASIQYKELSVNASSNIKVIPELVYRAKINTEETLTKLNDSLVVLAEAYKVTVNGETVAFLKNAEEYEQVINQLKLQYVSQEQIDELNARQLSKEQLPPLKVNETRLVDISFNEKIAGEKAEVAPKEIKSSEEVVKLLKTGTVEQVKYAVQEGDVLESIAKKHNLKLSQIKEINPGITEDTLLQIGQQINVTAHKPYISVSVVYENLAEEKIPFKSISKDDNTILKGESKVVQEGSDGKKEAHYQVKYVNGQKVESKTIAEKVIVEPVDKITHVGTKVIPSRGTGKFVWPTNGGYISSTMGYRWGAFHKGIDIARPSNYTIKAADNGTVTFVGWDGSYGRKIVINHNNGYQTVYAHLSAFNVRVGQVVQAGSAIGVMGSTGNSTGVHLHFEVLKNGVNVNPLSYVR